MATVKGLWKWNNTITAPTGVTSSWDLYYANTVYEGTPTYSVSFSSGGYSWTGMLWSKNSYSGTTNVYNVGSGWASDGWSYIEINEETSDEAFKTYLRENATKLSDRTYKITVNCPSTVEFILFKYNPSDNYSQVRPISTTTNGDIVTYTYEVYDYFRYVGRPRNKTTTSTVYNMTVNGETVDYVANSTTALQNLHTFTGDITVEVLDTVYSTNDTGRYGFRFEAESEEDETTTAITFDLSTLGLSAGTYSITVKARADGYADSAESSAVSYTVSGASLISFTIAGTEYQAEEGMTWAQWCESEYNTHPWKIFYDSYIGRSPDEWIVLDGDTIQPTDTIAANNYTIVIGDN